MRLKEPLYFKFNLVCLLCFVLKFFFFFFLFFMPCLSFPCLAILQKLLESSVNRRAYLFSLVKVDCCNGTLTDTFGCEFEFLKNVGLISI